MQFNMQVFTFKGLQNYGPVQEKLFDLLRGAFLYTNYEFQQAVEEARTLEEVEEAKRLLSGKVIWERK